MYHSMPFKVQTIYKTLTYLKAILTLKTMIEVPTQKKKKIKNCYISEFVFIFINDRLILVMEDYTA